LECVVTDIEVNGPWVNYDIPLDLKLRHFRWWEERENKNVCNPKIMCDPSRIYSNKCAIIHKEDCESQTGPKRATKTKMLLKMQLNFFFIYNFLKCKYIQSTYAT